MNGIINVLKPVGMTSHDVINCLRRILQTKKIGHAGTLDPDAAGVLPVFIGNATRLLEYAVEDRKHYRAEITLGIKTDTGDDSGKIIAKAEVPHLDKEKIKKTLQSFLGISEQIPPMYSAIKINGKKLYQLARQGIEIERQPRTIEIYELELIDFNNSTFTIDVECSKGTYIRTLIEDIAESLGTCATMSFLLRQRVGIFDVEFSNTLQEIENNPQNCLLAAETVVTHIPVLTLTNKQAMRITQGVPTTIKGTASGKYRLHSEAGVFLGMASADEEIIKADKIFQQIPKSILPENE